MLMLGFLLCSKLSPRLEYISKKSKSPSMFKKFLAGFGYIFEGKIISLNKFTTSKLSVKLCKTDGFVINFSELKKYLFVSV